MNITGTATINVLALQNADEETLNIIKEKLSTRFSETVDEIFNEYGIQNIQIHSCIVDELYDADSD